ncbi:hypothetical protein SCHPADRAFT_917036 [Schizopora paradoxa]|uniref:Translation machinery-associated protein 16 n=1 Tax=Schizopora paradoxa TaxID=27342 RepID=A0A0H2R8A6_9AGAM|nr:hypothetical protein SCHPADRAFT_917036 [Schizopora paradoxa]
MTAKSATKEKIFHPKSRKAGQVERAQLRKAKLEGAAGKRAKRNHSQIDKYVFFYHAMPPECEAMSLEELHAVIRDVWLTRHDMELNEEIKNRRKGNPKSAKQSRLENFKAIEAEEYRTGLEVPDLTHPKNVELFRRWDQKEVAFIDLLRFIRISSADTTSVVLSRPGKHASLKTTEPNTSGDTEMAVEA